MTTQAELFDDKVIWSRAKDEGIFLVPWGGANNMTAAITEELVDLVLMRMGIDPEKSEWSDINKLGLGFFVEHSVPGTGDTLTEAYLDAIQQYHQHNIRAKNERTIAGMKTESLMAVAGLNLYGVAA